jgi:hypothetical protein
VTAKAKSHHYSYPKVLITVRSELLSGKGDYKRYFLPLESQNKDKDEDHEAGEYYLEQRFTPFGDKRQVYQSQFAALDWRNRFVKEVAPKLLSEPASKSLMVKGKFKIKDDIVGKLKSLGKSPETVHKILVETFEVSSVTKPQEATSATAGTADEDEFSGRVSQWLDILSKKSNGTNTPGAMDRAVCRVAMLAATAQLDPVKSKDGVERFLRKHMANGDDRTWTTFDYNEGFDKIPELKELTDTPFMTQIVTKILPHLIKNARPVTELKSGFVVLLNESVAEVVWAILREVHPGVTEIVESKKKAEEGGDKVLSVVGNLPELQKALDDPTDPKHSKWKDLIKKLAEEITDRVEEMIKKHPEQWKKDHMLPAGCEYVGEEEEAKELEEEKGEEEEEAKESKEEEGEEEEEAEESGKKGEEGSNPNVNSSRKVTTGKEGEVEAEQVREQRPAHEIRHGQVSLRLTRHHHRHH